MDNDVCLKTEFNMKNKDIKKKTIKLVCMQYQKYPKIFRTV